MHRAIVVPMDFRVLGPLSLAGAAGEVAVGSPHQRRLLAALLLRPGRVVPVGTLVDALWGTDPPATAATTIQSYASRLRRLLGPGVLAGGAGGYRLAVEPRDVDACRFEALVAAARGAPPAAAAATLDEALALWRGDPYPDLAHDDAGRAEAVRLTEMRAAAREERASALLALGRDAVGELAALTAEEPLRERPWRLLMLALHRAGRQAEALAAYRRYAAVLDEDGLEPSAAIRALHTAILAAPERVRARPAARTDGLVGRDEELAAARRLLRDGPLVTLTGPAGVGKSRLAAEVAREEAAAHLDGARTVPLAQLPAGSGIGPAVAAATGLTGAGLDDPAAVAAALAGRDLLLVLDNAEHVLDAAAALAAEVVAACPAVAVLVTSQERLGVAAERVLPVRPLGTDTVDGPAVRLFLARARAADPLFHPGPDGTGDVLALCRRLDGLPLAVEMAAARTVSATPRDLLDRLDRRFTLLRGGRPAAGDRHGTLRAAVDWSVRLLPTAERELLADVSVFPATFDAAAAAAVTGRDDVAATLDRLVDRSLVGADLSGRTARFGLLETLRFYGADLLRTAGRDRALRDAHTRWAVGEAERLRALGGTLREDEWLAGTDALLPDLRAAAAAAGPAEADRLAAALHLWVAYRLTLEPTTWATTTLATATAAAAGVLAAMPAVGALAALGHVVRGDLAAGDALASAVVAAAPGTPGAVLASMVLVDAAVYAGRLELAVPRAELPLADPDPLVAGETLTGLGLALVYAGEPVGDRLDRVRRMAARTGSPTLAAWADYLGGEALTRTDPGGAVALLDSAVATARAAGNRLVEGVALVAATACRGRHGEPAAALAAVREAVAHWHRLGDRTHQWPTLRTAAVLLSRRGEHAAAVRLAAAVAAAGPPPYGEEAADLARVDAAALAALGPDRVAAERRRGEGDGVEGAVALALDAGPA